MTEAVPPVVGDVSATPTPKTESAPTPVSTEPVKTEAPPEPVYELKAPQGVDVAPYVNYAKELGLSPTAIQKMLDRDLAANKAQEDAIKKEKEQWKQDIAKDSFIDAKAVEAGYAKLKKDIPDVAAFIESVGGLDHPKFHKMLTYLGKSLADPRFVGGSQLPASQPKSTRESLEDSIRAALTKR